MEKEAGLVYSTQYGKMCPSCNEPMGLCVCGQARSTAKGDGIVRVGRETKGRKGRGVTIITGVPLAPSELASLGKQLKKKCGSGGTVKDGVIEIQGEHRDLLVEELKKQGWAVKHSGG